MCIVRRLLGLRPLYSSAASEVYKGQGVGSQGDGSVQFLCASAEKAKTVCEVLQGELNLPGAFVLEVPASKTN